MELATICSPPYIDSVHAGQGGTGDTGRKDKRVDWQNVDTSYGFAPGQLGAMKEGTYKMLTTAKVPHETWFGCYANGWQEGELVADAFSHPAKMAKGLIYRIVSEGLKRGYWTKATTILDPFGGIGSTGLACAAFGIPAFLVELEPKFVALAEQTFALHRKSWDMLGLPHPRIVQGDSRRLREIVADANGSITSPPWTDIAIAAGDQAAHPGMKHRSGRPMNRDMPNRANYRGDGYGTTPGQLGAMKEGSPPVSAITSPPYAESDPSASHAQGTSRKNPKSKNYRPVAERDWQERETPRPYHAITSPPYGESEPQTGGNKGVWGQDAKARVKSDYMHPSNPGNIGNLAGITSPPFSEPSTRDRRSVQDGSVANFMQRSYTVDHQAADPANIARLPIGAVTSPPYENNNVNAGNRPRPELGKNKGLAFKEYGESKGQLGNESGETYWEAVRTIYEQLYELFSPGSHAAIVIKAFVRNKKIIPLPQMTLDLLVDIGFAPVLWVDAKLTGEAIEPSMLAEVPGYQRKKASFFRRLHERKSPATAIDEEVILFVGKL